MKHLYALLLISLPIAGNATTDQVKYDLEVGGMVCAFCAYNVSKQLAALDGVVADSVDVDLAQGAVALRSTKELDRERLADVLLQAGFTLIAVTQTSAPDQPPSPYSDQPVLLSVTMESGGLEHGEFDEILEGLGALAVRRSGRIRVMARGELEGAILKPLLGGRQTVIRVVYDEPLESDQMIIVSVLAEAAIASN